MDRKLRIGLLTDNDNIPAWSYLMLKKIIDNDELIVVLNVRKENTSSPSIKNYNKLWKYKNHLLWLLYAKLENILFKPHPNAFKLKNIKHLIKCKKIYAKTTSMRDSCQEFTEKDLIEIKKYNIDVFINISFICFRGGILELPKYGIWSYCHSDRSVYRGGPPGAWEVFKRQDVIGVMLEILSTNIDRGKVLATSFSSTEKLSINRTINNLYWKSSSLLPRKLIELYSLGEVEFFNKLNKENNNPEFFDNKIQGTPKNIDVIRATLRILIDKIRQTIKSKFYFGQWILLYKFEVNNDWSTSFYEFKRIVPPKDRFWADPFIVEKNNSYFIFFEELIYTENIGKIAVLELGLDGSISPRQIVLDKEYHLSYPFIFEDDNELYMIPETSGNRTIELYRCIKFPHEWEMVKTLMRDIYAVDSTILKHDDKYWLFCNIKENEGASSLDELFLFYSDNLHSDEWVSHPKNPIISDVSRSRPAGKIFSRSGQLFRPSQDSAKGYGHGMKINKIVELTTTTYHEETIQSIYPNWSNDIKSTHTINQHNKLTVIDAVLDRWK